MQNKKKFIDTERKKTHTGLVVDAARPYDVIDCIQCGFMHVIPIPSEKELARMYENEYYVKEKPLYFKRMEEDLAWWNIVYASRYDIFEKYLFSKRRKILDVGSGPGYFLSAGKKRGWDTLGVEPSKQAAEYSRTHGLEIVESFLDNITSKQLGAFDVVHMSEVLEHLSDPVSVIKIAYRTLRPGGLLCVVSPNDYNPLQKILREKLHYKPWWVAPPHHINYFNFDSIERLLRKNKFSIIEKTATFPMEFFLLSGDNYVGSDTLGRACHMRRKNFEMNLYRNAPDYLEELYRSFARKGIGREFVIIARKK